MSITLNSVDAQQVRALAQLKGSAVVMFLENLAQETKTSLVAADEMGRIHRLQGRAQAYDDLIKAVQDAAKIVERR